MVVDTVAGRIHYRNDHDLQVIREVVDALEYFRWGNITVNPGDTVIDCGAHIGSFTRLALTMGARVLAIEPHVDNFDYLMKNTESFGKQIILMQAVLWDGKDVKFRSDPERGELHKVTQDDGELKLSVKLDQLVDEFGITTIDLLKMDIEGSEYEVLYNFKNLNLVQQLTMEWHYGSTKMSELIIFLEKNGFKIVWLGGNGEWGKIQAKRKKE